jgi:hypothetical protein
MSRLDKADSDFLAATASVILEDLALFGKMPAMTPALLVRKDIDDGS